VKRFWILDFGFWIASVVGALVVGGCGREADESPAAPPRVAPVFGNATIRGTVKFVGQAPKRAEIANKPCHDHAASPLLDETVVVNEKTGTLANVFVYLADAPPSDGSQREPAVLDQKDCRYVPHVVGVQVGQTLRIRSSDPKTLHNTHYVPSANRPGNFGLTDAGAERKVEFDKPEFIRVKCDVHPWMTAYVGVFDSPFFATSDENAGAFEIAKVPAGKYKLVAWHEQLGQVEQPVDVKDGEAVDVTVTYKGP
jgi:plastocyanin